MAAFVRILFGFVLACLAGALTQVLFVITPVDLYALEADRRWEQAGRAMFVVLSAATQFAIFAAPFAGVAILFGLMQGLRGWGYYVFLGLAVALLGFTVLYVGEDGGDFTIANSYAVAAFAFSGIIAGYVYWLVAGHRAGAQLAARKAEIASEDAAARSREHLKASDYGGADKAIVEPRIGVPDPGMRKTH